MKRLTLISAIILASGCATNFVTNPLPLPEPLVLPKVEGSELQCLTDEAYESMVKRDKLQGARIETLRRIIEGTHSSDK